MTRHHHHITIFYLLFPLLAFLFLTFFTFVPFLIISFYPPIIFLSLLTSLLPSSLLSILPSFLIFPFSLFIILFPSFLLFFRLYLLVLFSLFISTLAIALNPQYVKAYIRRADSHISMGGKDNIQKSINDYQKALEYQTDEKGAESINSKIKKVIFLNI